MGQPQVLEKADTGRRRAAGIYGAVVTAAIIAAVGEQVPTRGLAIAVVVTLLVYWVAEQYAELLASTRPGVTCRAGGTSGTAWRLPGPWSPRPTCRC
jgi:hypothetical protein